MSRLFGRTPRIPPETAFAVTPRAFTIGDTAPGVVESYKFQASNRKPGVTVIRGVLLLSELGTRSELPKRNSVMSRAALLDAAGRKVLDLHPGANDVSRLAAGVYFVREEPPAASLKSPVVRKVVVLR